MPPSLVSLFLSRGLVLTFFSPVMAHIGYGLPWQYIIIATWSGLRGAVGLALALIVSGINDPNIPKDEVGYKVGTVMATSLHSHAWLQGNLKQITCFIRGKLQVHL